MKKRVSVVFIILFLFLAGTAFSQKIFDVHLHGHRDKHAQIRELVTAGVYKVAISTSWDLQQLYTDSSVHILYGLMFPCPGGKVPYSLQPCYSDSSEWPSITWVENQIRGNRIHFFGEILNQYYGISAADSLLIPYYSLAEKYSLPVGIHTGGAGPNHGSPNFKMELGNPAFIEPIITRFPKLKIWIMHAGDQFYLETIRLMKKYPLLYADISVLSNPAIVSAERFSAIMRAFIAAGLEDRLMFGSDNGEIQPVITSVKNLPFSESQKEKIFYRNAERFFSR